MGFRSDHFRKSYFPGSTFTNNKSNYQPAAPLLRENPPLPGKCLWRFGVRFKLLKIMCRIVVDHWLYKLTRLMPSLSALFVVCGWTFDLVNFCSEIGVYTQGCLLDLWSNLCWGGVGFVVPSHFTGLLFTRPIFFRISKHAKTKPFCIATFQVQSYVFHMAKIFW